jgi:hypothetical protein
MEHTDWNELSEFAQKREELNPGLLRALLAVALVRRGYGAVVVAADTPENVVHSNPLPGLLALGMIWSFGISAAIAAGLPWYLYWCGLLGAFALLAVASSRLKSTHFGGLLLVAWVAIGVAYVSNGALGSFGLAYGVPLAVAAAFGVAFRTLRLRDAQDVGLALGGAFRGAPLVAPIVLIVLFIPAMTRDVWQVADQLDTSSLLLVGCISVGLLFVIVRIQLGSELGQMLRHRANHLSEQVQRSKLTRDEAGAGVDDEGVPLLETMPDSVIDAAWPANGGEYAPYIEVRAGESLQQPLTARLGVTTALVGLALVVYIYVLCAAVVPIEVASAWSGAEIPSTEIQALGAEITIPGGVYLKLAALLGLAATATFLSFALVEERFAVALTDALLREPSDKLLALAIPYLGLRERWIEDELDKRRLQSSTESMAEDSSSGSGDDSTSGR